MLEHIIRLSNKIDISVECNCEHKMLQAEKRNSNTKYQKLIINMDTLEVVENEGFDESDLEKVVEFAQVARGWILAGHATGWFKSGYTPEATMICAIDKKTGNVVYVDEVPNGLACECKCMTCGEDLIARQGTQKAHSFAHKRGSTCNAGYETSLHLAAKDYFLNLATYKLPKPYIDCSTMRKEFTGTIGMLLPVDDTVMVNSVDTEVEYETPSGEKLRADIVLHTTYLGESYDFIVEICVNSKVDEKKLKKFKELKLPAFEMYLGELKKECNTKESIYEYMETARTQWLYYFSIEEDKKKLGIYTQRRDLVDGVAVTCPKRDRCTECAYCIYKDDKSVLCGYKTGAIKRTLGDIRCITYEDSENALNLIKQHKCPDCGGQLLYRELHDEKKTGSIIKDELIGHLNPQTGCRWAMGVPELAATQDMEEILRSIIKDIDGKGLGKRYYESTEAAK